MKQFLMVPIQLDAMYVNDEGMSVVEQTANFPVQPYFERTFQEEINSGTANISESIVSLPFQNRGLHLGLGVHLHWALPDALTHGDSNLRFPEVPTRWLITRRKKGEDDTWLEDKQWVVESDYLFPPHLNKKNCSISVPYTSEAWIFDESTQQYRYHPQDYQYPRARISQSIREQDDFMEKVFEGGDTGDDNMPLTLKAKVSEVLSWLEDLPIDRVEKDQFLAVMQKPLGRSSQPYRYMGRKLPIAAWKDSIENAEYYPSLTATGYGEPTFAAFYPNCYSVFGFHDSDPGDLTREVRYEVVGWYGNEEKDVIAKFMEKQEHQSQQAVRDKFSWNNLDEKNPTHLLCYAGLEFSSDPKESQLPTEAEAEAEAVSITVANTPTEALSACIADKLVKDLDSEKSQSLLRSIEDQMEALQLSFRLDESKLDLNARFKELRHENGFVPVPGGMIWVIREEGDSTVKIPEEVAEQLKLVNGLQRAYDQGWQEIESRRKQLFADWYKYMIAAYPPDLHLSDYPSADLLKHFIETKVIRPLKEQLKATGELGRIRKDKGNIKAVEVEKGGHELSVGTRLSHAINRLIQLVNQFEYQHNKALEESKRNADDPLLHLFVEQIPGPRYWQPNNPVVLIEGETVKATKRHGQDGILDCHIFSPSTEKLFKDQNDFSEVTQVIRQRLEDDGQYKTWKQPPWNPFQLEWEVQLYPTESQSNLHEKKGVYSHQFITDNYEANALNPDLELKTDLGKLSNTGNIYSGKSLLTPQANKILTRAIEEELQKNEVFGEGEAISLENYRKRFESHPEKASFNNANYTMICAYEKLSKLNVLSQSLNGFNDALLMHKKTLELPIDDPLAFDEYHGFTADDVHQAMGEQIKNAPDPMNVFNPIRSGCLKILKMRLVDTFGQIKDLKTNQIDTTYKMTSPRSSYLVRMPPRLVQPARLNFRWLDAQQSLEDMASHQDSSPICGWLMTNRLDRSLMVYNGQGQALGYFKGRFWKEAIDSDQAQSIAEIKNPHLKRVVEFIEKGLRDDDDFLSHFNGTLDDALDHIQAEKSTAPQGPAGLIGRPIAVVRASLDLELRGLPAINQDWNMFRQDIGKQQRSADRFTRVQFPVRLGEHGQLNDGLVGYWLEKSNDDGSTHSKFYSPQSDFIDSQSIESRHGYLEDGPINFYQSIEDPPQQVTLLMDIQGSVHATVGVLPNKAITIPKEHYTEALQNIEVSFLHAPLLTQQGKINLPLRPTSDYEWSWVEQRRENYDEIAWDEYFLEKRIERQRLTELFNQATDSEDGEALWDYLLDANVGWLARVDDDEDGIQDRGVAKLVNRDERKLGADQAFAAPFKGHKALVQDLLDEHALGIDPVSPLATFTGPQEIKEGWLKLRKRTKVSA